MKGEQAVFKRIFENLFKPKRKQYLFVYCPHCKNELISSDSFVSDEEVVTYCCTKCQTVSQWNFDIAPVPILLK